MKLKVLVLIIVAVGIVGLGLMSTISKARRQKRVPQDNQIQWHIQEAKNQGRKQVTIQSPIADYLGSADYDIDKALSEYMVVVASPIESRTYEHSPNSLITWHKFTTVESLTNNRPPLCFECNSLLPPPDMLPLLAGEFLVPRAGGTIRKDGVELTEVEPTFPPFKKGQKYLMLISLYPSGVALTAGGPVGIFPVDDSGTLTPLTEEPHKLKEGIKRNFQGSLHQLRTKAKEVSLSGKQ